MVTEVTEKVRAVYWKPADDVEEQCFVFEFSVGGFPKRVARFWPDSRRFEWGWSSGDHRWKIWP